MPHPLLSGSLPWDSLHSLFRLIRDPLFPRFEAIVLFDSLDLPGLAHTSGTDLCPMFGSGSRGLSISGDCLLEPLLRCSFVVSVVLVVLFTLGVGFLLASLPGCPGLKFLTYCVFPGFRQFFGSGPLAHCA